MNRLIALHLAIARLLIGAIAGSDIACPFCGTGKPCTCAKTWTPGYQPSAAAASLFPAAQQTGWLCPRCGASNSPAVQRCWCGPVSWGTGPARMEGEA